MANHKSAKKRAKQNLVKCERNKSRKTESRSLVKKLKDAIHKQDKENASKLLILTQSLLAKAAQKGACSAASACRRTSRLASQVAKLA